MSDTPRAAPPPHDPNDPDRTGTGAADPATGAADWNDPFGGTRPVGGEGAPAGPMRMRPADPEAALAPRTPPPRPAPPRRPGTNPRKSEGGAFGWVGAALVYSGAALLGASIYQGKRTSAAEAGHPPIGRFLESDGATFHYVDIGEGPPIVLLHGIGSTLDDWFVSGVLDRLLPHHRIIAIDRPGYGYSSRPGGIRWTPERQARAMARMLHRLGAHEATVVAHSFGVLPAMALALQHSTFARNLVLIGGVYMPGSFLGRLSRAVPSVPLLGPLTRGSVSPALARAAIPSMVRTMFEPQPVTRAFRERFSIDFATRPGQLRAAADDLGAIDRATRRFLPHYRELDIPVAVVTGSGDAIFDPDLQSRPFAAMVPNASLVVIPAGGHLVHHTSPDLVSEVILETAAGRIQPSDLGPPPDIRAGRLEETPSPEPDEAQAASSQGSSTQQDRSSEGRSPEPSSEPEEIALLEPEATALLEPEATAFMEPEATALLEPEATALLEPEGIAPPEPEEIAPLELEELVRPEPEQSMEPEPEQRTRREPGRGETADTSRDRAAASRAGSTAVSEPADEDDDPDLAAKSKTDKTKTDKAPAPPSPIGPASSAQAASAAASAETASASEGADEGDSSSSGAAPEASETATPKRRRSRSRRKSD